MSTARLTKARLALIMDAAKSKGARVKVNLATGEADIDFGAAPANDASEDPDEIEARRIQELMNNSREPAKR